MSLRKGSYKYFTSREDRRRETNEKYWTGKQMKISVSGAVDQGERYKPPDLTAENGFPVEAEQGIEGIVSGHLSDDIDNGGTGGNIEHQVGNALISVCIAEALKAAAKVFQGAFTPKKWFCLF